MVIESISIESFGKLNNVELCFDDGINVIEGKNESGKSTVAAFIRYMLYGFTGRNSDTSLSDKKKFISWKTSSAAGSMTVRTDAGERYKILRRTVLSTASGKEVYRDSASITDLQKNESVYEKQSAGDAILKMPAQIFDSIAFVGQFSDSKTSPDTAEAIENMLFSGNESVNAQKAVEKLELARRALLHKNGKGGEIYELSCKRDELSARLSDAIEKNKEIFESESILSRTRAELGATEAEIERLCEAIELYNDIMTAKQFSRLHDLEDEIKKYDELSDALTSQNTYEGFCPDSSYITSLAVARSALDSAKAATEKAKEKVQAYKRNATPSESHEAQRIKIEGLGGVDRIKDELRRNTETIELCEKKAKTMTALGIPLCLVLVGIFILIAAGAKKRKARAARGYLDSVFAKFGVTSAEALTEALDSYSMECRHYESAAMMAGAAESELSSSTKDEERAKNEFSLLLAKWNIEYYDGIELSSVNEKILDFTKKRATILECKQRASALLEQTRSALAGKDETSIIASLEERREKLAELVENFDVNKINEALAFARSKQRALLQKERDLSERYLSQKASSESPSRIKEALDATDEKISALKRRHEAYVLAAEAIEGAGASLRAQMSPKLSQYAKKAIKHVTDGKYSEIGVDSSLTVSCEHENELRSPEAFSAGTRMAIYLSLRLALIDMLSSERLPLCMDETLAYQDDDRARALLSFLSSEECSKAQCFIFTCHTRESEMLADSTAKIIRL